MCSWTCVHVCCVFVCGITLMSFRTFAFVSFFYMFCTLLMIQFEYKLTSHALACSVNFSACVWAFLIKTITCTCWFCRVHLLHLCLWIFLLVCGVKLQKICTNLCDTNNCYKFALRKYCKFVAIIGMKQGHFLFFVFA